jgi:hypothetical protein
VKGGNAVKSKIIMIAVLFALSGGLAWAQTSAPQQSLASAIDVYVFPTQGQDAAQQSIDEATCYDWAVQNTGSDPFDLQKQAQQQQQQHQQAQQQAQHVGAGAGARGAVGGAAGGALIGAIAGDTGKGAAYGAAAGLLMGRRAGRHANAQAQQQVAQQGQQQQQATAQQIENFKKAFSVCLEATDYLVKY